ncbi:hypothetical protein B0H13DRAFT_1937191 [Mycena leptocephala]|nr:hypothetical protein B0H13DRAFT_1937191 [Mycena leptocephala]
MQSLIPKANESPLTVEEFVENIQNPVQGKLAAQEDAAIGRLIRGYGSPGCARAWRDYVHTHLSANPTATVAERIESINERNELDLPRRMQVTHEALEHDLQSMNTGRLVDFLLYHISAVSFGMDWRQIQGKNSRKTKQEFYERTYQNLEHHRDMFADLSAQERRDALKDTHKEDYHCWRKEQEELMIARNRFVDVYLAFGPVIFLDPFWDVAALKNDSRTKEFGALLKLLKEEIPEDPHAPPGVSVATSHRRGSCAALRGVAHAIGPEVLKCLQDFCGAHPDEVPGADV